MANRDEQPQPMEPDTRERMKTTGQAVVQAVTHEARGEHETQKGAHQTVQAAEVERIIAAWPDAQQTVARQMIAKYGTPNEATLTQLFWYANDPWKRTVLTSDVVVHNWP